VSRDLYRVVGIFVHPSSREVTVDAEGNAICGSERSVVVSEDTETRVTYAYSVRWQVLFYVLVNVNSSTRRQNGLLDGINICTFSTRVFIGSV
jgi:hypothetical protein